MARSEASRSQSEKEQAETRANEALNAAQAAATDLGRIAEAQESRQTAQVGLFQHHDGKRASLYLAFERERVRA